MSLQKLDLVCMFWMDHCIIPIGTVVWWLAGKDGSAVVGGRCPGGSVGLGLSVEIL